VIIAALILGLYANTASSVASPVGAAAVAAVVEQPRPTGYFVGDLLTQRILLQSAGGNLNPTTVPTPGRVSAWFDRRRVTLEKDSASRSWLAVQYQILNAPQKLTTVTLPAWTLTVKSPAGLTFVVLKVPSSRVSVAPLSPPGSPAQVGTADLRPYRVAPMIPLAPIRRGIAASGVALMLTVAAWLAWLIWRNRRAVATQPFAAARRELRSLNEREPRAWQVLHRAFDRTAGRVIQTATLPELFERAPQFTPARERIEQFFAQSSLLFFGAPAHAPVGHAGSTGALAQATDVSPRVLCEELWRIERRYER
jgi:mxaA protein